MNPIVRTSWVAFGVAALASSTSIAQTAGPTAANVAMQACVLIDTDFDIDDMMAVPMVLKNRHVVGIVATEGATSPPLGAAAMAHLLAQPGFGNNVPIIVGATASPDRGYQAPSWLARTRITMEHLNDFEPATVMPKPLDHPFEDDVARVVEPCTSVTVLALAPWTSFARYASRLAGKLTAVVAQGRPAHSIEGDNIKTFNCAYDLPSCQVAFTELKGIQATWVDVPKGPKGKDAYSPMEDMITALDLDGIAGNLRATLMSHPETWRVPTGEGAFGGSYMWDQLAAMYLLQPEAFHQVEGHMEPRIPAEDVRRMWTAATNGR